VLYLNLHSNLLDPERVASSMK